MARPKSQLEKVTWTDKKTGKTRTKTVDFSTPIRRKMTLRINGLRGVSPRRTEYMMDIEGKKYRYYVEPGRKYPGMRTMNYYMDSGPDTRHVAGIIFEGDDTIYMPTHRPIRRAADGTYTKMAALNPPYTPNEMRDDRNLKKWGIGWDLHLKQKGHPTGRNKASHKAKRKSPKKPSGW